MADEKAQVREPIEVGIVPHTHWDREWYAPFQTYRAQLVHLLDDLLDLLEHDDAYARFLLDGQTAVLDDYFEVRPDAEPRLAALVGAGRVQIGPWMVLMDEYMVSAETMVRDLQLGIARGPRVGWGHERGLPARHVRARRADAADPRARRPRARGRVARRAVEHRPHRVLVGSARRLARARRVPLRVVLERPRHPERREPTGRARTRLRARARRRAPRARRHAVDERLRPSAAAVLAGPGRRRRQPATTRVPLHRHVVARVPRSATDRRAPDVVRRAAVGRPCERAHGRGLESRRRAPARGARRARDRARRGAAQRALPTAGATPRRAPVGRVAQPRARQRARLVVRVQPRRGRRGRAGAVPGSASHRRRAGPRRPARARHRSRRARGLHHRREPHANPARRPGRDPGARRQPRAHGGRSTDRRSPPSSSRARRATASRPRSRARRSVGSSR